MKLTIVAALLNLILLIPARANACSDDACINGGYEMRPSFDVKVTHENRPLATVEVSVTSSSNNGARVFQGRTSRNGRIRVGPLMPGDYWIVASLLGVPASQHCFHIARSVAARAKRRLRFTWGDSARSTQEIAGALLDTRPDKGPSPLLNIARPVTAPITGATLLVRDPFSADVREMRTGSEGEFRFDSIPRGLYVIHIEGGKVRDEPAGINEDVLVRLDPYAEHRSIVIRRKAPAGGSCGGTSLELRNILPNLPST